MNSSAPVWASGPLSFQLDPATGFVRWIRWHGHEALRGIYSAVRDENWGTLASEVAPPRVDTSPTSLRLRLAGRIRAGAELDWEADIAADSSGCLRYQWRAVVLRALRTNRTGLCVLHPATAAGAPCEVEHHDGRVVAGWFPTTIAPHQPFTDLRSIVHTFARGAEARVQFDGEIFEMEDQRNWTDASFKTYCRPLDWPRPYTLKAGDVVEHTVTLTCCGLPAESPAPEPALPPGHLTLPRLGFTLTAPLPAAFRARALALRPSHVRVDTDPGQLAATLAWSAPEAAALGCELEVAIHGATADAPARDLFPARTTVLLHDAAGLAVPDAIVAAWRAAGFSAIGNGTCHHFTELNRQRPAVAGAHSFTAFGLNAQVHTFDDDSILETLSQHPVLAAHALALGGGRSVSVGPIVFGPAADSPDPRLRTELGALWTCRSLVRLARAGVARATYFRLHGAGGILQGSEPGALELLFRAMAGAESAELIALDPADAASDALLLRYPAGHHLVVAHQGTEPRDVRAHLPGGVRLLHLAPRGVTHLPLPS